MTTEEAERQLRRIRGQHIEGRWSQLYHLSKESGDSAIRYLFTTNAGGAVAVLAYLGSVVQSGGVPWTAKFALVCFFTGLLFVGFYRIYLVHHHEGLFENYKKLVGSYYEDDINWHQLLKADEEKVGSSKLPYVFGYLSFLNFICGCIAGAVGIF